MNTSHKRAILLLKAVIFLYHDFTEEENRLLKEAATELDAQQELEWILTFIQQDTFTAYERTREYLRETFLQESAPAKLNYLKSVWQATGQKGHITEMEALAMIKLARDWHIETEFIKLVRTN